MLRDARKLTTKEQELLRLQVVDAVINKKMAKSDVADFFNISRYSVYKFLNLYNKLGNNGLKTKKRGRRNHATLKPYQCSVVVRTISDKTPDQLKFPFMLWDRKSVQYLIKEKFDIT